VAQLAQGVVVTECAIGLMGLLGSSRQQRADEKVAKRVRSLAARHQPARCESGSRGNRDIGPWTTRDSLAERREEMTGTATILRAVEFIPVGMTGGSFAILADRSLFGVPLRSLRLWKILSSHITLGSRKERAKAGYNGCFIVWRRLQARNA